MDNADEVDALMLPWLLDHDKVDVFKRGQERGLGFAYVASMADILEMEQLRERDYFVDMDHPVAGSFTYAGPAGQAQRARVGVSPGAAAGRAHAGGAVVCPGPHGGRAGGPGRGGRYLSPGPPGDAPPVHAPLRLPDTGPVAHLGGGRTVPSSWETWAPR